MNGVREALAGLTTRGRAFLAAGVTAAVCAVVLGQPALVRVGVLLAALPLVAALVVGRSRYRLALVRTVVPQVVTAGQTATVSLALSNEGRAPTGALLLEDHLPYALGTRPRFVLEGIGHGWRQTVTHQVRSDVRGRFELGPMSVRVNDPFGMVELGRAFRTVMPLIVTPRTVPLPFIALGGAFTGSGSNRLRAFSTGSPEDVTVREYRSGDELRRVHWRSSARAGQLMVRREEQPWQSRATLFVDTRSAVHRGQGVASSLEAAISAAASVAVHLCQRGYAVRLVTAMGEDPGSSWRLRKADTSAGPLLEALAVVHPSTRPRLETSWLAEAGHGGVLVAVMGAVQADDGPVLRRMLHHADTAMAISLEVDAWTTGLEGGSSAVPLLVSQGWRAVSLRPGDRLDAAWRDLGSRAPRAAAAAPGAGEAAP